MSDKAIIEAVEAGERANWTTGFLVVNRGIDRERFGLKPASEYPERKGTVTVEPTEFTAVIRFANGQHVSGSGPNDHEAKEKAKAAAVKYLGTFIRQSERLCGTEKNQYAVAAQKQLDRIMGATAETPFQTLSDAEIDNTRGTVFPSRRRVEVEYIDEPAKPATMKEDAGKSEYQRKFAASSYGELRRRIEPSGHASLADVDKELDRIENDLRSRIISVDEVREMHGKPPMSPIGRPVLQAACERCKSTAKPLVYSMTDDAILCDKCKPPMPAELAAPTAACTQFYTGYSRDGAEAADAPKAVEVPAEAEPESEADAMVRFMSKSTAEWKG